MITLSIKQKIIIAHLEGLSNRAIAAKLSISKDTVNKYVKEYNEQKTALLKQDKNMDTNQLIEAIMEKPKYDTSNRKPAKVTPEIMDIIESCMESNRKKRESGMRKQQMKKCDIYEKLLEDGYDISYSTVKRLMKSVNDRHREAFIKQEHMPGDICEFDWGEVKLNIGGTGYKSYQMAVFTAAMSNLRFAMLFRSQDTPAFQQSHAEFFHYCKGAFHTMVYDNMKVAVKRFVGLYEKEPTEALMQLSIYYGFTFRFCNIASGNEKGHVERSVEFIRRKAFCKKDTFHSLVDANQYLRYMCDLLNEKKQYQGKHAMELFEVEKAHLLPALPIFESCLSLEVRVDKYATITYSQNHYSVPDDLVGKLLTLKAYTDRIKIYHDHILVATHTRSYLNHDWVINLRHYLKTLYKKPGALSHSTALLQADTTIKNIYERYYTKDARTFLEVLEIIEEKGIDAVKDSLRELERISPLDMSSEKVRSVCDHLIEKKSCTRIVYTDSISEKSRGMLSAYSKLASMQCTQSGKGMS